MPYGGSAKEIALSHRLTRRRQWGTPAAAHAIARATGSPATSDLTPIGHAARGIRIQSQALGLTPPTGLASLGQAQRLGGALTRYRDSLTSSLPDLSPQVQAVLPDVLAAARRWNVDPALLLGQEQIESGFNPQNYDTRNYAGAGGISQFIPSTGAQYGVRLGRDRASVKTQIEGQAHYMHDLGASSNPTEALNRYWGAGGAAPTSYSQNVLGAAQRYSGVAQAANRRARAAQGLAKFGVKVPQAGSGGARGISPQVAARPASVAELFYDPGISLKNGQPIGAIGGHGTHVHVASNDPRAEKRFINIARRRFGLNVGENVFVGDPPASGVHVSDSYHYRQARLPSGRAIDLGADITGSPGQMAAYDQFIARKFGNNPQVAAGNYGSAGASVAGFSAGFGGSVPVGSSSGGAGGGSTPASPAPAYPIGNRAVNPIAALTTGAADVGTIGQQIQALLGGGGQADAQTVDVLQQILGGRGRFRPRRR